MYLWLLFAKLVGNNIEYIIHICIFGYCLPSLWVTISNISSIYVSLVIVCQACGYFSFDISAVLRNVMNEDWHISDHMCSYQG